MDAIGECHVEAGLRRFFYFKKTRFVACCLRFRNQRRLAAGDCGDHVGSVGRHEPESALLFHRFPKLCFVGAVVLSRFKSRGGGADGEVGERTNHAPRAGEFRQVEVLPRFVFVEGSDDEFSRRVDFEGVAFLVEWEEMIECAADEGLC